MGVKHQQKYRLYYVDETCHRSVTKLKQPAIKHISWDISHVSQLFSISLCSKVLVRQVVKANVQIMTLLVKPHQAESNI